MENEEPSLRPEEMVPYVREYLGLLEDIAVIDAEIKRCLVEYRKRREALLQKKKPMDDRFRKVENTIKKTIHDQKLPGIRFKNVVFTIEEKVSYKQPEDKIRETLERNPIQNDSKTLAKLLAEAIRKKCRRVHNGDGARYEDMVLRVRSS